MLGKFGLVAIMLGVSAWAAQDNLGTGDTARLAKIENAVSQVMSKAGILFNGEFRSQFLLSNVDGNAVTKNYRKDEGVEYTSVDFDVSARPNTELAGRALFRLHEDWRNMWASFKEPIVLRWLSVDGLLKNVLSYNIGDFRQRYSPLTLWSPDVEIAFEPQIFSRLRKLAADEMFLGDNDRIMQGVNINFDAEIFPVFKELHLNALGSRLRTAGGADPGQVPSLLDTASMDKYLIGANCSATIIPDVTIGGSFLNVFDATATYGGPIADAELLRQNTRIFAGRGSFGTGRFIDKNSFHLSLDGEVAVSSDDTTRVDSISATRIRISTESVNDLAIAAGLKGFAGLPSAGSLQFNLSFVRNGPEFRNELAQSPTLFPVRIMNSENDPGTGRLYSTYDALYRQVFKFCPSENAANAGSAAGWLKGPMSKIGYTNGILSQKELKRIRLDQALFLCMPYGAATPNRTGIKGGLNAELFKQAVRVSAFVTYANEIDGLRAVVDTAARTTRTLPQTAFIEAGGGASIDVATFGRWWPYPCIVSGAYKLSSAVNDGAAGYAASPWETAAGFANAGLYWTLWKKLSLLGGFQLISTASDGLYDNVSREVTQTHAAGGLEFKVSKGSAVTGSFGIISVAHDGGVNAAAADFSQMQTDLFLNVRF